MPKENYMKPSQEAILILLKRESLTPEEVERRIMEACNSLDCNDDGEDEGIDEDTGDYPMPEIIAGLFPIETLPQFFLQEGYIPGLFS
jgi:hypothetical protein